MDNKDGYGGIDTEEEIFRMRILNHFSLGRRTDQVYLPEFLCQDLGVLRFLAQQVCACVHVCMCACVSLHILGHSRDRVTEAQQTALPI